jgi:hypothetical protein
MAPSRFQISDFRWQIAAQLLRVVWGVMGARGEGIEEEI